MFKYNCECGEKIPFIPKNGDLVLKVCEKCGKIFVFNAYKLDDGFEITIRDTCIIDIEFIKQ